MSKTFKHQRTDRGQFAKARSNRRLTAREQRALAFVIHEANVPFVTDVIFGK
ncbi:hypothetical protein TIN4_92 [Tsukamurella phage TIN4]|uniref:Uncharacterized protein n=2 Tax=Tinduovirus TIN3 TaxID=1982571 RepID=A0A0K0N669_9CAUD|nr:hypothetical protein AVT54_gp033 [Tsukamurella phage TIN3]YP_009604222.1 hypothetical protein FDH87_gp033 [Tsukamurella phage TIN4]AKJ71889.1 hypothetical protein TIN3_92 [Tsukamurella phage TIN3]AKJ71998.1 hypothetical protein TIN4_92 [Tsukamurella phage TIN4]